ncbi:MAG: hypothetical protein HN590_15635 [Calditrichaeota bacterium]|jgi:hypothetical protein|nr:hypothetical protein [Calditrichota bacterium]
MYSDVKILIDFEKCNKIGSMNSLSVIAVLLSQIVKTGETDGWIKSFSELEEEEEAEEYICPDCSMVN